MVEMETGLQAPALSLIPGISIIIKRWAVALNLRCSAGEKEDRSDGHRWGVDISTHPQAASGAGTHLESAAAQTDATAMAATHFTDKFKCDQGSWTVLRS